MVPIASAILKTEEEEEDNNVTDDNVGGKLTKAQRRKKIKSRTVEDGPRTSQKVLLVIMWLTAALAAIAAFLLEQLQLTETQMVRQMEVTPYANSSAVVLITRNVDMTFCLVWRREPGLVELVPWVVVVSLPVLLGPVLTTLMELIYYLQRLRDTRPGWVPNLPSRTRRWTLIYLLTLATAVAYPLNLYIAEWIVPDNFQLPLGDSLVCREARKVHKKVQPSIPILSLSHPCPIPVLSLSYR